MLGQNIITQIVTVTFIVFETVMFIGLIMIFLEGSLLNWEEIEKDNLVYSEFGTKDGKAESMLVHAITMVFLFFLYAVYYLMIVFVLLSLLAACFGPFRQFYQQALRWMRQKLIS